MMATANSDIRTQIKSAFEKLCVPSDRRFEIETYLAMWVPFGTCKDDGSRFKIFENCNSKTACAELVRVKDQAIRLSKSIGDLHAPSIGALANNSMWFGQNLAEFVKSLDQLSKAAEEGINNLEKFKELGVPIGHKAGRPRNQRDNAAMKMLVKTYTALTGKRPVREGTSDKFERFAASMQKICKFKGSTDRVLRNKRR